MVQEELSVEQKYWILKNRIISQKLIDVILLYEISRDELRNRGYL